MRHSLLVAQTLTKSGIELEQAHALAEAIELAMDQYNQGIATKDFVRSEILRFQIKLGTKISDVNRDLQSEIAGMRVEISGIKREILDIRRDISDMRREISDMKGQISDMKNEIEEMKTMFIKIEARFSELRAEASAREAELMRWVIGAAIAVSGVFISSAGALIAVVLHHF